jgi:hypothetical protein
VLCLLSVRSLVDHLLRNRSVLDHVFLQRLSTALASCCSSCGETSQLNHRKRAQSVQTIPEKSKNRKPGSLAGNQLHQLKSYHVLVMYPSVEHQHLRLAHPTGASQRLAQPLRVHLRLAH